MSKTTTIKAIDGFYYYNKLNGEGKKITLKDAALKAGSTTRNVKLAKKIGGNGPKDLKDTFLIEWLYKGNDVALIDTITGEEKITTSLRAIVDSITDKNIMVIANKHVVPTEQTTVHKKPCTKNPKSAETKRLTFFGKIKKVIIGLYNKVMSLF